MSAAELQARADALCKAQPGYGTPSYRGDPLEAVALQQAAERAGADDAFISAARNEWASDEIEIDDDPTVSAGEGGAWVAAWVWVSNEEAGLCSECGDPTDDGEGYDGLCGDCADKADPA